MSSVLDPWKGWVSVNGYLASGTQDKPVLLVLDSLGGNGDKSRGLWNVFDSPSIRNVLESNYARMHDCVEVHPEMRNMVAPTFRATVVDVEDPSVFVLSSDLLPIAAITTRSRSGRVLPAPRIHAQLKALLSAPDPQLQPRDCTREQHMRKQMSACHSATISNASDTPHAKALEQGALDECLKRATYKVSEAIVDYLDTNVPGIVYMYTDHLRRYGDCGILSVLARTFVLPEPKGRSLLSMNIDNMLTSQMYDVIHGGFFDTTDFAWRDPSPYKVLVIQFHFAELLLDCQRKYPEMRFRHFLQWTVDCCLRDLFHAEDRLFLPLRSYASGSMHLSRWSIGDFNECLSPDDMRFLEDTLDLEEIKRVQHKNSGVRLKRLDLADNEFDRLGRLAQKVATRKRQDFQFPPCNAPRMFENALAARILLDAGVYLNNRDLEALGTEILDQLWMGFDEGTGSLASTFHNGCWKGTATLIDYAFLTEALFACYAHTLDRKYLERAEAVHRATLSRFWHEEHGTFTVFSKTYTDRLDALRGVDFLSGVGSAMKNHVLFSRHNGEEPTDFIHNVLGIFFNGLVTGADDEYTDIVDFLNACAVMNPVRIMYSGNDSMMWREILQHLNQLPQYCRRNLICLNPNHKQSVRFNGQALSDNEFPPNAICVWADAKPVVTLRSTDDIESYFGELRREFAANLASIKELEGLKHLRD